MGQLYAQQQAAQRWLVAQGIDRAVAAKYVGGVYHTISHDSAAAGPVSQTRTLALSPSVDTRCPHAQHPSEAPPHPLRTHWTTLWPSKRREVSTSRCRAWMAHALEHAVWVVCFHVCTLCVR